ncbi:hypothetical protein SFRURICE_021425 [Spodoptera frugiperda]|nr:hypothetical protein SFRURICE_021425 [Spodoptera frugiperda]
MKKDNNENRVCEYYLRIILVGSPCTCVWENHVSARMVRLNRSETDVKQRLHCVTAGFSPKSAFDALQSPFDALHSRFITVRFPHGETLCVNHKLCF